MKLTRDRIVDAGMAVFADVGYQSLSMRQVADRLGVQAGSLYYHVKNKESLLALLADRVAGRAYVAGTAALSALPPDSTCSEQVMAQMSSLRLSVRAHRGGAVLLATSPRALSPAALSLMERLLHTVQRGGAAPECALVVADTLLSYVTGFILQEQVEHRPVEAVDLTTSFPLLMASADHYHPDELFTHSIALICSAARPETSLKNDAPA